LADAEPDQGHRGSGDQQLGRGRSYQQLQHELVALHQRLGDVDDRGAVLDRNRTGGDTHPLAVEGGVVEDVLVGRQALGRRRQLRRSGYQLALGPEHLVVDAVLGIDAQRFDRDRRKVELEPVAGTANVTGDREHGVEQGAVVGFGGRVEGDAV